MSEIFDLNKFDEYKEDNRREVKKAKGGLPNSLWDTYSSFANCYGGVIILGVSENADGSWRTTGLTDERKLFKDFWDIINNKAKVSLNILSEQDVNTYTDEGTGNVIMTINVPRANRSQKPIYLNGDLFGSTFRRNFEGDYHCTREEVLGMLRDESDETCDLKVLEDMSLDVVMTDTFQAYRNRHRAHSERHVWSSLSDEEYLERIEAARISKTDGKLHPTVAGLLMFGEEYKIHYEYPEYFLDYKEMLDPSIRWTDRLQSSSGEWSGNLFDFFFRVYEKLTRDLKIPFQMEGITRVDDTPVHKAIREALANCIVNADFFFPRGIIIKKDADSIVIENPGSIRIGKKQMLKGGISDPRSKALMKMFNMIGIGERAGSGVPDIFEVWESQGWRNPIVEEEYDPDRTRLILSFSEMTNNGGTGHVQSGFAYGQTNKTSGQNKRTSGQNKRTSEREEQIRAYLRENGETGTAEISSFLGLSMPRTRAILSNMNDIEKYGATNKRVYRLKHTAI